MVLGVKLHLVGLEEVVDLVLGETLHRFGLNRVPGYGARSDTAPGGP